MAKLTYTLTTETPRENKKILSISEITKNIRYLLETNFSDVWIEGEISGAKLHSSGHFYFSLKDEFAQISCVMFRKENALLTFQPDEGMKVLCLGRVSVYPVRGQYQFYVEKMEPQGVGALQIRFEQLKKKLLAEGFFDESLKKPLPYLPKAVGIVTSGDGAALRDILNILSRRNPALRVLIYPVPVQGPGAAEAIAEAITDFNIYGEADVLIVGRGGGSIEDLWAFNEEVVARAIFTSQIPIISAVGHEVDFTIADFVADLRAATPSAAAELVSPIAEELLIKVESLTKSARLALRSQIQSLEQTLDALKESRGLKDPLFFFEVKAQKLEELKKSLKIFTTQSLLEAREKISILIGKLEALGPLATLRRGFSVTTDLNSGAVLTHTANLKINQQIKTRLGQGGFVSKIIEIHN